MTRRQLLGQAIAGLAVGNAGVQPKIEVWSLDPWKAVPFQRSCYVVLLSAAYEPLEIECSMDRVLPLKRRTEV